MKSSELDAFLEYPSLCTLIIKTLTIFLEYTSLCTLIIKTLTIFLEYTSLRTLIIKTLTISGIHFTMYAHNQNIDYFWNTLHYVRS